MLARIARQSGGVGRRRPVPTAAVSTTSLLLLPPAGPSPSPPAVGADGALVAAAARHLRRYPCSQLRHAHGGIAGASSALRGGGIAARGGEGGGERGRRDGVGASSARGSAGGRIATPPAAGIRPPTGSHRFRAWSEPDGRAAFSQKLPAQPASTSLSSLLLRQSRALTERSSPLAGLDGGVGGGRHRGEDNPLFARTMRNVVRRAMSSSAPRPAADDTTVYEREKMKSASAAAVPPPPPAAPVGAAASGSGSTAATASSASTAVSSSSSSSSTSARRKAELTNPPTLVGAATDLVKSIPGRAKDLTVAATRAMVRVLAATPGVLWFYLTHPNEFRQKLLDLKEAAKKEAHHYWMGSKLLAADLRTARGLLNQTLRGSPLTRRERKQLLRTVSDVFRLVPMSIFVLVPFMEFALPFALKLFPNMLPSTFQDSLKAEENMKRELKGRIAMAEFFQETLQDLAKEQKKRAISKKKASDEDSDTDTSIYDQQQETAASFIEFIEKARKGEMIPPQVIIKFSSYFQDELTLDNMPRMQLVNMSKYMGLPPYGSDNFLRLQLRFKMRSLLEDDQRILWEGIDSLTKMELREACQERGMRSTGLSKDAYKRALQQWLDLSVNKNVPISLLIMSRTFFLQEEMTTRARPDDDGSKSLAGLADAISGLDKEVLNEVVLEVASAEEKTSNPEVVKIKLEVLEHQNELIAEEKKERDEAAAKKKQLEEDKKAEEKKSEAVIAEAEEVQVMEGKEAQKLEAAAAEVAAGVEAKDAAVEAKEPAPAPVGEVPAEEPKEEAAEVEEEEAEEIEEKEEEKERALSTEEMEAISQMASPDPVHKEREELKRLKAAMKEQEEEEEAVEEDITAEVVAELPEAVIDVTSEAEEEAPAEPVTEAPEKEAFTQEVEEPKPTEPIIISDESDKKAAETIAAMDAATEKEAAATTKVSFEGEVPVEAPVSEEVPEEELSAEEEEESRDERLDKAVDRLKSRIESMVGKIEVQLSDVEAKIGDKMHLLDKDGDDIISMDEMAQALQTVLRRKLTFEEAVAIAEDMDTNKDGFFTVEELAKWVDTNKLVKLVEEGRDGEVDRMIAQQAAKMKEKQAEESLGEPQSPEGNSAPASSSKIQ